MANFWDWVNKQANNRYENRFTDAATGKGVGISKTDYSRPRSNNNQSGNLYAEAVAKNANSSSLQGTIDPDRTGTAAPPRKGLYDQTGMNATAENAASGAITGAMAGAGRLPNQNGTRQPTTTPTQPGTSGGGKVTYIDPNGDAQKGTTEGTPEETPGEPQRTYLDELRDQYQKMYDDAVKANNDAAKAAAERALAQAEKGVGELGDQYGSLNKQLYRDYMESLRVLPQEMAARGYSGGMSESARLGLDTAYGERLNENEAARIAAIMQLRQQGADAEYQANAARDQANAQAQQNLYANMMNLILQQQQDAAQKAQNMAQYGDFSGYLGLGYTQSEIDQMQKAWIAANPELARTLGYVKTPEPVYSSYGGSGGGKNNTPSAEQKANGRDLLSEAIQLKNGGTPYSQIAKALDEEAAAGTITTAQAEAAKRAAISSGLDNAYASMKKNTTQKAPVSGGRLITEGDFYSQILGGRK